MSEYDDERAKDEHNRDKALYTCSLSAYLGFCSGAVTFGGIVYGNRTLALGGGIMTALSVALYRKASKELTAPNPLLSKLTREEIKKVSKKFEEMYGPDP